MKTRTMIIFSLLATTGWACKSGCIAYEGNCACEAQVERVVNESTYQPSDEKPPRHPEPAWQRGEVIAATPSSCAFTNACSDQQAIDATAQGKKSAGIK